MSIQKQFSFTKIYKREFGGDLSKKNERKLQRPIDPKLPIHVVMKSHRAKGSLNFLKPKNKISILSIVKTQGTKYNVKIYRYVNVGNHLHFVVKVVDRKSFQFFLRTTASQIALQLTGAKKGKPVGRFWEKLAYSRVTTWGREWKTLQRYMDKNYRESLGIK